MTRPSRPVRVLASTLAAGTLLATAACSGGGDSSAAASAAPVAEQTTSASPSGSPTGSPTGSASPATRLTNDGAKAALITEADIEDDWTQADDAQKWSDKLLVGKVDVADFLTAKTNASDCQKLLDGLYSDDLLGKPSGSSALTGFTDDQARLLYQVADYGQQPLTTSLDWLGSLPQKCDTFTATGSDGGKRTVQVVEASMPKVGDDRRALTVTVKGTTSGEPTTLTVDVAAVRVGDNGITVTNGGLDGADHDSTEEAAQEGTSRLKDVLAGRTPTSNPSEFD